MRKFGVVMAGGGGTRFWPLSRQKLPKQLLNLTGNDLMINETIDRLSYTVDKKDIFIVTNHAQAGLMLQATQGRIAENNILSEPCARSTAACIGYAAVTIMKNYGDGIMVITPSDAYVRDNPAFTRTLTSAIYAAEKRNMLVTVGIEPTFPATGYGYIKYDRSQRSTAKSVIEFSEKPDKTTAEQYIATGAYAWNSGMFIWKASTILEKYRELVPEIYEKLCLIRDAIDTENEDAVLREIYPQIPKISVDYAILEPSARKGDVLVVPGQFGWSDVGSWDRMDVLNAPDEDGNIRMGQTITINTRNSILYSSGRLIATVDVDDLVIVDTPDVIMVCKKENAQDVRLIVDALSAAERDDLL